MLEMTSQFDRDFSGEIRQHLRFCLVQKSGCASCNNEMVNTGNKSSLNINRMVSQDCTANNCLFSTLA